MAPEVCGRIVVYRSDIIRAYWGLFITAFLQGKGGVAEDCPCFCYPVPVTAWSGLSDRVLVVFRYLLHAVCKMVGQTCWSPGTRRSLFV